VLQVPCAHWPPKPPVVQGVPSATGEAVQVPGSTQASAVQGLPSSHTTAPSDTQAPPWQDSTPLQARPSLQEVPSGRLVLTHEPVGGSQAAT